MVTSLTAEFEKIVNNLEVLAEAEEINEFEKAAIIDMGRHVVDALAKKVSTCEGRS